MASSSSKKTASSNEKTLKELHLISLAINTVCLLALFLLGRPQYKIKFFVLSIPSWLCQYSIEVTGRPRYSIDVASGHKKILSSGSNLHQVGLLEYMFDIIYVTWIIDILMVVFGSNHVWWLYLSVPGFAIFKITEIIQGFKGGKRRVQEADAPNTPVVSKRQAKREMNQKKGKSVRVR